MANIWASLLDSEREEERAQREYKEAILLSLNTIREKSHLYFTFGLITFICYPFGVYGAEWAKWLLLVLVFFLFNGEFVVIGAIRRLHMVEASSVYRAHFQMAVVAILSLAYTFVGLWRGWFVPWLPLIVAVVINSLHGAGFAPRKSSNRMAGNMKDNVPDQMADGPPPTVAAAPASMPADVHPDDRDLVRAEDIHWRNTLSRADYEVLELGDTSTRLALWIKLVEKDGLSTADAGKEVRLFFPAYYLQLEDRSKEKFAIGTADAQLPYALKDRINRAVMAGVIEKQAIMSASSFNALVRQMIRAGSF